MARPSSIRGRLTVWHLIAQATALGVLEMILYADFVVTLTRSVDDRLRAAAASAAAAIARPERGESLSDALDDLGPLYQREGLSVAVFDHQGVTLGSSGDKGLHLLPPLRHPAARTVGAEDAARRVLSLPAGRYVVEAALPWDPSADSLEVLRGYLLLLFAGVLAFTGIGGWLLVGSALRPIEAITSAADRITADDLDERLPVTASDREMRKLVSTLNRMIARLSEALESQRRFTADASHELRTPITVLQNEVEVALARPRHPVEYRRVLESVLSDCRRMGRLVNAMLDLMRDETSQTLHDPVLVPLADLCRLVAREFEGRAETAGIGITLRPLAPDCLALGSPERLRQLLENLLDNAIKYTPGPGDVRISLRSEDRWCRLEVRDTGPGIPPQHLPRLFERFYRVDRSRSRATGGTGLGLAICQQIARQHGGEISVQSEPGQGSTFIVKLPSERGVRKPGAASTHDVRRSDVTPENSERGVPAGAADSRGEAT